MKKYSIIIAGILIIGIAATAYASILFTGTLTVSNNGTDASEVCTTFSINASYLQDVYGVDDEFDYVKILNSSGENVTFMPGYGINPWCIFVPEISEYTTTDYEFYTGNASLDGKKAIFLNDSMTITDDPTMECGDNLTMTFDDYYISGNRTWVSKTNAYSLVTSSGNITFSVTGGPTLTAPIIDGEHDLLVSKQDPMYEYTDYSYSAGLYGSSFPSLGIGLNVDENTTIDSIDFHLEKVGSPTGTANITVRDWNTHSVIGILGTIDVSTITNDWYTFGNDVTVNTTQYITITIDYSGGDASNRIRFGYNQTSIYTNYENVDYIYYLGYWQKDVNYKESAFRLTHYRSLMSIDGVDAVTSSDDIAYPNTANDAVIYAPYYLGSYNLNVDGTDVCTIPWSYGATLTDQSGSGNDATPTFRTTCSDADVSAELTEYLPYAEADAVQVPIGYGTIFDEVPEQPETAYSENTSPGLFFAPAINAIIDITPIPRSFFWYNFAFAIIILAGMVTWRIHQSLILKAIVMTAFMILFALPGINIYGMYTVIYFSFFNFGLIVISRSYGL